MRSFRLWCKIHSMDLQNTIDHKSIEDQIPVFLEDRLDNDQLDAFLEHMKACEECRDELQVQYLVKEGLPRIETGENFSLNEDLDAYVDLETRRLNRRLRLQFSAYTLEFIALLAMLGEVFFLIRHFLL